MDKQLMTEAHQAAPWDWALDMQQAATLLAAPAPRWLRVEEGRVWITAQRGDEHGPDIWLAAGESLALPAGTAWVVEAWPQARLSLLQAAPVEFSRAGFWQRAGQAWRAGWAPSQLLARLLPHAA
jgi:hypothetical protein